MKVACPKCIARTAGIDKTYSCGEVTCPVCIGQGRVSAMSPGAVGSVYVDCAACVEGAIDCPLCEGVQEVDQSTAADYLLRRPV